MDLIFYLMVAATVFVVIHQIGAKNILLLPGPAKGHVRRFTSIGEGLMRRGHQAIVALHRDFACPESARRVGVRVLRYGHHNTMQHGRDSNYLFHNHFLIETLRNEFKKLEGSLWDRATEACTSILADLVLYQKLSEAQLDFVLVDAHFAFRCLYIIPHKLGVPYGGVADFLPTDLLTTLMTVPSFYPHQMSHDFRSPATCFTERLKNCVEMIMGSFYISWKTEVVSYKQFSKEKPYATLRGLAENSKLWIIDSDPLLDFPFPTMPHVVYSGGTDIKNQISELPKDLEEIISHATHGIIVVTFGNDLHNVPNKIADNMTRAFGQLRETVIWKNQGKPNVRVPANVKLRDWIPKDLLIGHPKTRLFVSHCGPGGQNEAINHGVPMIAFPITGEQTSNAMRLEMKGIAIRMDIFNFTAEQLADNIREILNANSSFTKTAKMYSEMLKDRPVDVHQSVMFWIEHVMKYGGDHLRSQTSNLAWYELLLFDVVIVMFLLFIMFVAITSVLVWAACRTCYKLSTTVYTVFEEKEKMD